MKKKEKNWVPAANRRAYARSRASPGVSSASAVAVNKAQVALEIEFLRLIAYTVIIASAVQLVEMYPKKYKPSLFRSLGIFLPLLLLWLGAQQFGRRSARAHPDRGRYRAEGGGCGKDCGYRGSRCRQRHRP